MADKSIFRRAKGTPQENMRHTLHNGFVVFLILFFVLPDFSRVTEEYLYPDPSSWIEPKVEVVRFGDGSLRVRYQAKASHSVKAHFTVQTRTKDNGPICSYRSPSRWAYSPNTSDRRPWKWDAFFEGSCPVPSTPFKICLRYDGVGEHGTPFDTPFTCSDVFDPRSQS